MPAASLWPVKSEEQPEPATEGRFPDFYIVGHHKSGTTALYELLRRHPEIFMPDLKEPRYLASDMRSRFRYEREAPHPQTLEEYLALFEPADPSQRVGEASATYLWSRTASANIAEVRPDARMIAILREPASFLRSLHLTFLRGEVESVKDLRKAMSLESARAQGRRIPRRSHLPQLLQYSEHVAYVEQLERYRRHFPADQMLVLIYDDFRADNEAAVRSVLDFLDVRADHAVDVVDANVTTRVVRSQQLDNIVRSASLGRGPLTRSAKAAAKAMSSQRMRHGAISAVRRRAVVGDVPPEDKRLTAELRSRFKPEVVALSEYLDRDLVSLWGYDRVD